ncbi:MAG: UDP-N-acetylmuramoyl-tripeptide--D-alanyl-D-alanine ligase [Chloroflexota bacterium]
MLTLAHFLQTLTTDNYFSTGREPAVSSVVVDSRNAKKDSMFVALQGERVDGHDYVAQAFANGARFGLVNKEVDGKHLTIDLRGGTLATSLPTRWPKQICLLVDDALLAMQQAATAWRKQFGVRVIGVTGSVGKTSSKELIHAVLSSKFNTFKSPGNRNSVLGLPPALFELRPFHERAVLEMAMYTTGEIAEMCTMTQPAVGVMTIIGPVHLERAGSMDNIVAAKRELIEALPDNGVAILNKDDKRVMSMADHTNAQIFTYGLDKTADLWADSIHSMGLDGMRFTLHHQGESFTVQLPMLGRHSVHTALRATAVGLVEGLTWEEIVRGLRGGMSGQLRLVAVGGPKDSIIIDDTYNSSPDSALAALNLLNDLDGRHVAVLGDMLELGYMEEESHRLVGRRAADVAQLLVAVGKRGRVIGEEALRVGMNPTKVHFVDETTDAIGLLEGLIEQNDTLLIKGSLGMRMSQIVAALGRNS